MELNTITNTAKPASQAVAVIGAGPIGLTLSILLS
jgi:2-polyprenyl-6-methoxyphenol hydroxylase-like FAD-dependent oxidoreductase